MMVETILESSQDFGMSTGSLPQWKRELLQRRLSRTRPPPAPAPPAPPPPPPPAPPDEDEELRYGPGIVKRLKSRYLSLALRDAPRRRPSVLRRAASLEHLLDERPPPAPRAPRPVSLAPPPPPPSHARRDSVKRARSVDALSRLDDRDRVAPPSPERERPPALRAARPPRRPQPLLRETERPPPDVVRSTLRKFESAPSRRPALAPRDPSPPAAPPTPPPPPPLAPPSPPPVELEPPSPPRSPAPKSEPQIVPSPIHSPGPETGPAPMVSSIARPPPSPQGPPTAEASFFDDTDDSSARPGSRGRYAFSATNPVLAPRPLRRVGVIRPMPAAPLPPPSPPAPAPVSAPVPVPERATLVNGHSTPEPGARSRIGAAGIERAWSGSAVKRLESSPSPSPLRESPPPERKPSWLRSAGSRPRAPAPAATSVVFNFSDRKEVPDYIENDGIILRASRRNRIKAGEPGVVVLEGRRGAEADSEAEELEAEAEERAPSPCDVRFVNDNVLINGKSSMPAKPNKDRIAKLKLQFDDTLTRTFEYPSEISLCEDSPASPSPTPVPAPVPVPQHADSSASLADNTHIASAALSRYTPSKTRAAAFTLGLTNPHPHPQPQPDPQHTPGAVNGCGESGAGAGEEAGEGEVRAGCGGDVPRSWSDARAHRTDLLF